MWYCIRRRRPYAPPFGLTAGRWYEDTRPVEEEGTIVIAYLNVDGEEVGVLLKDVIIRETKADYSYAYNVGRMPTLEHCKSTSFEMLYVPVCPEGHRGAARASHPTQHECAECERTYAVQLEDSGLVLDG